MRQTTLVHWRTTSTHSPQQSSTRSDQSTTSCQCRWWTPRSCHQEMEAANKNCYNRLALGTIISWTKAASRPSPSPSHCSAHRVPVHLAPWADKILSLAEADLLLIKLKKCQAWAEDTSVTVRRHWPCREVKAWTTLTNGRLWSLHGGKWVQRDRQLMSVHAMKWLPYWMLK